MSFYDTKAAISKDPIVGLLQLASKDTEPGKLTAIIGSAADDKGNLIVPEVILEEAAQLASKGLSMEYVSSTGLPNLAELMTQEVLGTEILTQLANAEVKNSELVCTGGTNAIATALLACSDENTRIITHNPHWAGYDSIALGINRQELLNFEILDNNNDFNIESFEQTIAQLDPNSKIVIIMNTPFDNPLGKDFGLDVWDKIAEVFGKYPNREIVLILDTAYIDFGPGGKDYSRLGYLPKLFSKLSNPNFHVIIASTLSKSFAIYGARVGAATLLSRNQELVSKWKDTAGGCIRGTYSNGSRFGQELGLAILKDKSKMQNIHEFQKNTVILISKRKDVFIDLVQDQLPTGFSVVMPDGGFFISIKIAEEKFALDFYQRVLKSRLYIPLISNKFLRVPICGLGEEQLGKVAQRIIELAQSRLVTS